ncbi:MAG TPA: recombinase RecJ [Thermoanaerobacterales bacterium]|jgi:c-di-AMP phosphodiesterase-like protein|nr:recombinase RecJ [Thermoanaerobacterales bacterium]
MARGNENRTLWWAVYLIVFEVIFFIIYDYKALLALLPVLGMLLYYLLSKKDSKPLSPFIETKTSFRQALWKQTLNELDVGVVLVDENKKIIWKNKAFSSMFQTSTVRITHINDLIPEDTLKSLNEEAKDMEITNRRFSIKKVMLQTNGKKSERFIKAYYIKDITELYELKSRIKEEEAVVCYFHVDNFDEIMVACSEENRPELLAKIDKTITQWVYNHNGLIKKYDRDKYLAVFNLRDFRILEETKFGILDAIREIKVGQVMTPTLSIGAAYGEPSLTLSGKTAQNALELCLGRGGDQVVVKMEGKTSFYGGKTKEMEKHSRVRARVISHALRDLIEESDIVMVLGHLFLDMDALGAGVGLISAVKSLNKQGYIILTPEQSPSVDSLVELLFNDDEMKQNFIGEAEALDRMTKKTLLVVVDTHRPSLLMSQKVLEKAERVVVIDHHRRGEEFIDKALLVYLEPYASSTSEMVTEMIQYMGDDIKITSLAATAMLSGIAVDTRNFAFKTGARTFEAASFLRRSGADPIAVYKLFQEDAETVYARAKVLKRAQEFVKHVVISYYNEEPKNPTLAAAQAANSLIGLKGVFASFVLVPMGDTISISGRSLGNINVQRILEQLGGGGHMTVAGAQLSGVTMAEALEQVKQAVINYMKEGETP